MRGYKVFIVLMFSIIVSAGVAQAADPIVIGSVEPFSPPGSIAQGSEAVAGIELAIEMLNEQGGLLDRPVEVQFEDTLGIPEKGRAAVEKLITKDKVPVVVGGNHSSVCMAMSDVANAYHIPTGEVLWALFIRHVYPRPPWGPRNIYVFYLQKREYFQNGLWLGRGCHDLAGP